MKPTGDILIFKDVDELCATAAEEFISIIKDSLTRNPRCCVALSGGTTPAKLFETLAQETYSSQIDWQKVHLFISDERNVPSDDAESNFNTANNNLITKIDIPTENVHRVKTELPNVFEAAMAYEQEIKDNVLLRRGDQPLFDLVMLGLGEDGHTASLFPASPALLENNRIFSANGVEKLDTFRFTLTFPVINSALNVWLIVTGEKKAAILDKIFNGGDNIFPVQQVNPTNGSLSWYLDQAAAAKINVFK